MELTTTKQVLIEKEEIGSMHFPKDEVLSSPDDIGMRRAMLDLATKLGNNDHNKVMIVFEDDNGMKKVNTTVWATTEGCVSLKGAIMIPIRRIHEIHLI